MFAKQYMKETIQIAKMIDLDKIEKMATAIESTKKNKGRIFFLGNGGSAGTSSHAVNDFRKIISIESYTPTDNSSELTARINDDGFDSSFVEWLKISNINKNDMLFILSVGGGSAENNISMNLVNSMIYAKQIGCNIIGISGRNGGYLKKVASICIIVPTVNDKHITPHAEEYASIITHLLVSHPILQEYEPKWESTK